LQLFLLLLLLLLFLISRERDRPYIDHPISTAKGYPENMKVFLLLFRPIVLTTLFIYTNGFVVTNHHYHYLATTTLSHGRILQNLPRWSSSSIIASTSITTPYVSDDSNQIDSSSSSSISSSSSSSTATTTTTTNGAGAGTATITNEIFNLVKSIVGAGVLSLPYGIATYGNAPSAILPAILLISIFGVLSGYGFGLIGRVCALTQTTSYKSAWETSISPSTSYIPAIAVTFKTICATLAYSMILGDTFYSLLGSIGITHLSKTVVLSTVTATVLLPLCLLKNLSSLAPFSLLGSLGMVYTAIAMLIRYVGPTYKLPSAGMTGAAAAGMYLSDLPIHLQPNFGTIGAMGVLTPVTSILLGMLSTSYMAHFNAPKFYNELYDNTIPRFMKVVASSFGISIALFTFIGSIGFLTFGSNASGFILNNYSTKDVLMSLSRVAVAVSLVGSYPLAFVGARDGLMDVFSIRNKSSNKVLNTITVALLSAITTAALIIPDVSFVLAFAGYVTSMCKNIINHSLIRIGTYHFYHLFSISTTFVTALHWVMH
jgi:amino acid permease